MFSETIEGRALGKNYIVESSVLGDAILKSLIGYLNNAKANLESFDKKYKSTKNEVTQWFKERENRDVVRWLWSLIRKKDVTETLEFLERMEEEGEELECFLENYIEIDEELFKYNLEDDIVQSIVEYFSDKIDINEQNVSEIIDNIIKGDLEKLGLSHLITIIKEEISKSRDKDKKSWKLTEKEKREIKENSIKIVGYMSQTDRVQETSKER